MMGGLEEEEEWGGGGILYDNSHPPCAREFPNNERGAKQTT